MCLQDDVVRPVLEWLNGWVPDAAGGMQAEFLGRRDCFSFSVENAPVKIREFISGAFTAQLCFAVRFRTAAVCSEQRLDAMELLDRIAVRAEENPPALKGGLLALSVERASPVVLEERAENGCEDYLARFVLTFEAPSGL